MLVERNTEQRRKERQAGAPRLGAAVGRLEVPDLQRAFVPSSCKVLLVPRRRTPREIVDVHAGMRKLAVCWRLVVPERLQQPELVILGYSRDSSLLAQYATACTYSIFHSSVGPSAARYCVPGLHAAADTGHPMTKETTSLAEMTVPCLTISSTLTVRSVAEGVSFSSGPRTARTEQHKVLR